MLQKSHLHMQITSSHDFKSGDILLCELGQNFKYLLLFLRDCGSSHYLLVQHHFRMQINVAGDWSVVLCRRDKLT